MKLGFWSAALISIPIVSCNPVDPFGEPPIASFKITPEIGKTTDTIKFDASLSNPGDRSSKAYFRWDWNRDGIWDVEYSRLPVSSYRFTGKGTYFPVLEVINSDGLRDTLSKQITINQGFSAPHPSFTVSPEYGNFTTWFHFDASATEDDEDSIEQLRFRWDFAGNGSYVTPFSSKPYAGFTYQDSGHYTVILEVMDPQNLHGRFQKTVWVTNINPRLVADFNWRPETGTTSSEFILDASVSHSLDEFRTLLRYSWKLPPDYSWSEWTYRPDTVLWFSREATYDLELRIMDTAGLVNYCKKTITIYHKNLPPNPRFTIGCRRGNIKTQFYFNSWNTLDQESLPTTLEVRWDFNGDGSWDTEYSKERAVYYNYTEPGTYKVFLEARDPDGLSDTTAQFVEVTSGTNETGLIFDQRDGQVYGSIKIGAQWWMSQNLNFASPDWNKDEIQKWCYSRYDGDPVRWCNIYGGLYNVYHATRNDVYGAVRGICPLGWHIPSKPEWLELLNTIGGLDQSAKLLPGGETDFNALYSGFGEWKSKPVNVKYVDFKWIGTGTFMWSFTPLGGESAVSSWNIALIKNDPHIYPGYSGNEVFLSVRCVKDH